VQSRILEEGETGVFILGWLAKVAGFGRSSLFAGLTLEDAEKDFFLSHFSGASIGV
jgi:hypothetical protein